MRVWSSYEGCWVSVQSEDVRTKIRDLELAEKRPPAVVQQLGPVGSGEVSQVGDEGADQEDVATQSSLLFPEALHSICPAHVL